MSAARRGVVTAGWRSGFSAADCAGVGSELKVKSMNFRAALRAQPRPLALVQAALLLALIGVIDRASGWDVSLFLFYALPILLAVWQGGRRAGVVFAFACGVVWYWANLGTNTYGSGHAYFWAAINRLAYFLFVAIGGAAMKAQREEMRGRLEAMVRTRELEQEIVRVSEREQMRIGQDLHDGLCQNLAAINCAAACLKSDLAAKSLPEAEDAGQLQKLLKEAIIEARDLARGIFPVQMDGEGLPAALEELAAKTNRLRQVTASLEQEGDVRLADPQVAMHLYRIAQQALSNALAHADATRVIFGLHREPAQLTMTVTDNGRGFTRAEPHPQGMGLRTMDYRARLIGARLEVTPAPAGGTQVRCLLPLSHAPES